MSPRISQVGLEHGVIDIELLATIDWVEVGHMPTNQQLEEDPTWRTPRERFNAGYLTSLKQENASFGQAVEA